MIYLYFLMAFDSKWGEALLYAAVFVVVLTAMTLPYLIGAAVAAWVICRDVGWRFWHASPVRLMCGGLIFMATPSIAQALQGWSGVG